MSLATEITERAFVAWLLHDFDAPRIQKIALFLRPEDFADARYAHIYEAALAVLSAHDGPRDELRPDALYERLLQVDDFHAPLPVDQLIDIDIAAVANPAPEEWARHIVEDSARRRVLALSYRVEAAPHAKDPTAEIDLVRMQLEATLVQLQSAGTRVRGLPLQLRSMTANLQWRDALRTIDGARPVPRDSASDHEFSAAKALWVEKLAIAVCLQHPEKGKTLLLDGEIRPELFSDPYAKSLATGLLGLADTGVPLNGVSLFRALLPEIPADDVEQQQLVLRALDSLARVDIPDVDEAVHLVRRLVQERTTSAAVARMRDLPHRPDLEAAVVTDLSLQSVRRVSTAATRLQKSRVSPPTHTAKSPGAAHPSHRPVNPGHRNTQGQ